MSSVGKITYMKIVSCFGQFKFRGHYTHICLTNVKHGNNYCAWDRTEKTTVITKKWHFHYKKRRTLKAVKYHFYFFDIATRKNVIQV